MRRLTTLAGVYAIACLVAVGLSFIGTKAPVSASAPFVAGAEDDWFDRNKVYCNALEVASRLNAAPPPDTARGDGQAALCYALAGDLGRARHRLATAAPSRRREAAEVVLRFGVAVADAGDAKSAAPLLLVGLEFSPDDVDALFHAGMSQAYVGDTRRAIPYLRRFLERYPTDDNRRRTVEERLRFAESH